MKKLLFFIMCFFIFSPATKAFLGDDLGINLYDNINKGIEELELKQYEYELSGQGTSIKEYFNKVLKANGYGECIEKDLTSDDVEKISNGNIAILYSKIGGECLGKDGEISVATQNNIQKTIKNINALTKQKAQEKTEVLNNISRIGMYSDGNEDNSPFDLIVDLEEIDYYILTEEIPYNGEVLENNDELINSIFSNNDSNNSKKTNLLNSLNGNNLNGIDLSGVNGEESNEGLKGDNINNDDTNILDNTYKCVDDVKNSELSGLNIDEISNLLSNSNNNNTELEQKNQIGKEDLINNDNKNDELINEEDGGGGYKKLNDNSEFPCTSFFCITIDFVIYQHNLLGGGDTFSIEYLMNRSNEHLKKFGATSLTQAKMTSNNWEFGLKDLNLPDVFHVGISVSKQAVPILDIKLDEKKEDKTQYTKENLLEEYYKGYGLEWKRKNDISIFNGKYDELKTVLNLAEIPIGESGEKIKELGELTQKELEQIKLTKKSVYQKVINDDLADFGKRFIELRNFSSSIKNEIDKMCSTIRFMNKIPIDG